MKKKILLVGLAVALVAFVVGLYFYEQGRKPKRVWVEYSERYEDDDLAHTEEYELVLEDKRGYAEERLGWLPSTKGCIVLTHDSQKADYVVSISVIRYISGGDSYGSASLSITKRNGDVVLADHFYQDRNSTEDIAQQPITKIGEVLCPTASR